LHRSAIGVKDERLTARSVAASERTTDMADLRRCIGSTRFGIDAHDAPITDFPSQPSQKDGLGRMCKPHWNQYTAGLARDAKARKAAAEPQTVDEAGPPAAEIISPAGATAGKSETAPKPTRRTANPALIPQSEVGPG
jgi:hypothetical protein